MAKIMEIIEKETRGKSYHTWCVTIENVLTDNLYNDFGFIANHRLMILVEDSL